MVSSLLADALLLAHLLFILFVLIGGLFVWRRPWLIWLHIPAAIWGALVELAGWTCPLTPLEDRLRGAAPGGNLVERLLQQLIYPENLTRELQVLLAAVVLLVNLPVYVFLWRRNRHGVPPGRPSGG